MDLIVVNKKDLPSTTNSWGFGGSFNKKEYELSNGDVITSGTACFRHAPNEKWVNLYPAVKPDIPKSKYGAEFSNYQFSSLSKLKIHYLQEHGLKLEIS